VVLIRTGPATGRRAEKVILGMGQGRTSTDRNRAGRQPAKTKLFGCEEQIDRDSMFEDISRLSEKRCVRCSAKSKRWKHFGFPRLIWANRHGKGVDWRAHPQRYQRGEAGIYWCELCRNSPLVDCFRAFGHEKRALPLVRRNGAGTF